MHTESNRNGHARPARATTNVGQALEAEPKMEVRRFAFTGREHGVEVNVAQRFIAETVDGRKMIIDTATPFQGPPNLVPVKLTKELALFLLGQMGQQKKQDGINNRRAREHQIEALMREIDRGAWELSPNQPLEIDVRGRFINGQHRCFAIIGHAATRPGAWISVFLALGCSEREREIESAALARSAQDATRLRQDSDLAYLPPERNRLVNVLAAYAGGYEGKVSQGDRVVIEDQLPHINVILRAMHEPLSFLKPDGRRVTCAALRDNTFGAAMVLTYIRYPTETLAFIEKIRKDDGLAADSPAKLANKKLGTKAPVGQFLRIFQQHLRSQEKSKATELKVDEARRLFFPTLDLRWLHGAHGALARIFKD